MQATTEFEVYLAGELTVIGFGGREILDQLNLAECYDEIRDLIRENRCRTVAFDFTGVRWIPSGLLGVLMAAYRQTGDVHIYNPSTDIREVLEITKLDRVLAIHEIEL